MPSPARLLFVANSSRIAGGNLALLRQLRRLDRSRFEPVLCVLGDDPVRDEASRMGIETVMFDTVAFATTAGRVRQFVDLVRFRRLLARGGFRGFHANAPFSYRLPSLAAKSRPVFRLCHLQYPFAPDVLRGMLRVPPHAVVCCSEAIRREASRTVGEFAPESIVQAVVNCADVDRFRPGDAAPGLREELDLPPGTPVVTIVGQISARKGHADFLRMAARVAERVPAARFLVAGDDDECRGAYRREMESLASGLGLGRRVAFLGLRSDVDEILRASTVVVLPSQAEGLPLALVEAAACGLPLVAYDVPGVDEIARDGDTGRLVPVSDVPALSEAVESIVRDDGLRMRLGRSARRLAESRFSLTAYVGALESLYDRLLTTRPTTAARGGPA